MRQLRNAGHVADLRAQPVLKVRDRPSRLRTVHLIRSGQPVRVHAAGDGTMQSQEYAEQLRVLCGAQYRRA